MRCSPWKKKKSHGSLILNHSGALATHWMKPWAWKEGLFHHSGAQEGKWKHVVRMSCLGFALLPSSIRGSEACKQEEKKNGRGQQSVIGNRQPDFLHGMGQKKENKFKYLKQLMQQLNSCFNFVALFCKGWAQLKPKSSNNKLFPKLKFLVQKKLFYSCFAASKTICVLSC